MLSRKFSRELGRRYCSKKASRSWEGVVGLEVHAQLSANSKLFSASSSHYGIRPNHSVALFDAAFPGTLPALNERCVEKGVHSALALNCRVNPVSTFDRKHYFYADLPSGYQITQLRKALANDGDLDFWVFDVKHCPEAYKKRVKISQIQLEQDSGKSLQDAPNSRALIDLNRAGIGLIELITEPVFSNGVEALSFVRELTLILKSIGSCDCEMEKGHLRVDANISVRRKGSSSLGERREVKNLNSLKFIRKAIDYEIKRQIQMLERGQKIANETMTFDFRTGKTVTMRDKEMKQDYRFMPEPNLPPLRLSNEDMDAFKSSLPSLPIGEREEWIEKGVPIGDAIFIVEIPDLKAYYAKCLELVPKEALIEMNQLVVYTLRYKLMADNLNFDSCPIPPQQIIELSVLMSNAEITEYTFNFLLTQCYKGEIFGSIVKLVEESQLTRIKDPKEINKICRAVLEQNPTKELTSKKLKKLKGLVFRQSNFRIPGVEIESQLQSIIDEK